MAGIDWIKYVSFHKYCTEILVANEYQGLTLECDDAGTSMKRRGGGATCMTMGGGVRGVRGGVADLLRDVKRNNYRVHSPIHVAAFLKACNWHKWHLLEQKLDKVIVI